MRLVLLISLLISFPVFARNMVAEAQCTNSDIRDTNPRIKNNKAMREFFTTPRNQDSIGWCYAFAAADLLSAETGTPVSSMHASLIYNHSLKTGLLNSLSELFDRDGLPTKPMANGHFVMVDEGGYLDDAVNAIRKKGQICSEKSLPFDQHLGKSTMELIKKMEEIKLRAVKKKLSEKLVCEELSKVLPTYGLKTNDYEVVSHSLINQDINKTLDLMAGQNCGKSQIKVPRRSVTTIYPPHVGPKHRSLEVNFFTQINDNLNKGRPLSMTYDVKSVAGFKGGHVNIITARRWKNGRCEYKVRNSWGASCAYYSKGIDCIREEGAFWLSDEKLLSTATKVQFLTE